MGFVRATYCGQLKKPTNFSYLLLDINSEEIVEFVEVFVRFIVLTKFVKAYCHWPVLIN